MPSIAPDAPARLSVVARDTTKTQAPSPSSRVGHGLAVLQDLFEQIELPRSLDDELAALATLRAISAGSEACPKEKTAKLVGAVSRVTKFGLDGVEFWIRSQRGFRQRFFDRKRSNRWLLLLVLASRTLAADNQTRVLRLLQGQGVFAGIASLDELVSWLPRHPRGKYRQLADEYMQMVVEILVHGQAVGHLTQPAEFLDWSWPRQLLFLRARHDRARSDRRRKLEESSSTCLGAEADQIEFELASRGAFRDLGRRGGWLVRRELEAMGYRDAPRGSRTHGGRRFLALFGVGLLAASPATVLGIAAFRSWADNIRTEAAAIVQSVEGAQAQSVSWNPGNLGAKEREEP